LIFTTTTAYLTNSATRPGFAGGALADIPHSGRFAVGLDLRETVSSGTTGGSLFTAAARLALVPRYSRMRPYALLGGGAASGHSPIFSGGGFTGPTLASSNGVFVYGFGMDVRLTHSFDLRAIDVLIANGHGPASTTPGFLGPIDTAYPGVSFFSIDTGILYRFGVLRDSAIGIARARGEKLEETGNHPGRKVDQGQDGQNAHGVHTREMGPEHADL